MHYLKDANINSTLAGADPGFFLGGGALVSCSTTTPINQTLCTLPLDPPLLSDIHVHCIQQRDYYT